MSRVRTHQKIRHTIVGTAERPRLAVYRSLNNLTVQLIDDRAGKTLGSANSIKDTGSRAKKAKLVGGRIAKVAQEAKIKRVVFDRGGLVYQGVVRILAEEARKGGLEF